jgi:hypothetical protein
MSLGFLLEEMIEVIVRVKFIVCIYTAILLGSLLALGSNLKQRSKHKENLALECFQR